MFYFLQAIHSVFLPPGAGSRQGVPSYPHPRRRPRPRGDSLIPPHKIIKNTSVNTPASQLYNMGVDRPESEDLSGILRLYMYYLDNLKH